MQYLLIPQCPVNWIHVFHPSVAHGKPWATYCKSEYERFLTVVTESDNQHTGQIIDKYLLDAIDVNLVSHGHAIRKIDTVGVVVDEHATRAIA